MPTSWAFLRDALGRLGRTAGDVEAVVLTHAHFPHVGFAERVRRELGVPVYVHENDVPLTGHPWRYDHERGRSYYFATQVRACPIVATGARTGLTGHREPWTDGIEAAVAVVRAQPVP